MGYNNIPTGAGYYCIDHNACLSGFYQQGATHSVTNTDDQRTYGRIFYGNPSSGPLSDEKRQKLVWDCINTDGSLNGSAAANVASYTDGGLVDQYTIFTACKGWFGPRNGEYYWCALSASQWFWDPSSLSGGNDQPLIYPGSPTPDIPDPNPLPFTLKIKKVDENGKAFKGVKFNVNGSEKTTGNDGYITIAENDTSYVTGHPNPSLTKSYTITESLPKGYKKTFDSITITVSFSYDDDTGVYTPIKASIYYGPGDTRNATQTGDSYDFTIGNELKPYSINLEKWGNDSSGEKQKIKDAKFKISKTGPVDFDYAISGYGSAVATAMQSKIADSSFTSLGEKKTDTNGKIAIESDVGLWKKLGSTNRIIIYKIEETDPTAKYGIHFKTVYLVIQRTSSNIVSTIFHWNGGDLAGLTISTGGGSEGTGLVIDNSDTKDEVTIHIRNDLALPYKITLAKFEKNKDESGNIHNIPFVGTKKAKFDISYAKSTSFVSGNNLNALEYEDYKSGVELNNSKTFEGSDYLKERNETSYLYFKFVETDVSDDYYLDKSPFFLIVKINYSSTDFTYTPVEATLYTSQINSSGDVNVSIRANMNRYLYVSTDPNSRWEYYTTGSDITIYVDNIKKFNYNLYIRKANWYYNYEDSPINEGGADGAKFVDIKIQGETPDGSTGSEDAKGTTSGGWIKFENKRLENFYKRYDFQIRETGVPSNFHPDFYDELMELLDSISFDDETGKIIATSDDQYFESGGIQGRVALKAGQGLFTEGSGKNDIIVTVFDKPKYDLEIRKVNYFTGDADVADVQGINGVKFSLTYTIGSGTGNTEKTTTTIDSVDGRIKIEDIPGYSTVKASIKELTGPYRLELNDIDLEEIFPRTMRGIKGTFDRIVESTESDYRKWGTKGNMGSYYRVYYNINPNRIVIEALDKPFVDAKLRVRKIDRETNEGLAGAIFNVSGTEYTTDADGYTSIIPIEKIYYGESKTRTIKEVKAPYGYRVDFKDTADIKFWYDNGLAAGKTKKFEDNTLYSQFSFKEGAAVVTDVSGKPLPPNGYGTPTVSYDADTGTITVTISDTKLRANVQIAKFDYDKSETGISGAKFNIHYTDKNSGDGANKTLTTATGGVGKITNLDVKNNNDMLAQSKKLDVNEFYRACFNNTSYEITNGTKLATWKGQFTDLRKYSASPKKDVYTFSGDTYLNKDRYTLRLIESQAPSGYHKLDSVMHVQYFADDQGCLYAAVAGDEWGRYWVADVKVTEKIVYGQPIEDTLELTIRNSPEYTLNINKFEKLDELSGGKISKTDTPLTGAKFEAVRLVPKNTTTHSTLEGISGTSEVTVNNITNNLEQFTYKTNSTTLGGEPELPANETTEAAFTYAGNKATLKFWHEDFKNEDNTILYQIKETTPPRGYTPRNFYILVNTKEGNLTYFIGYERETNKIVFNKIDNDIVVDKISVSGNTINIDMANTPIKYNLKIRKSDIDKDDSDSNLLDGFKFNIQNIDRARGSRNGDKVTGTDDAVPAEPEPTPATGYIVMNKLRVPDYTKPIIIKEVEAPIDYEITNPDTTYVKLLFKTDYMASTVDDPTDMVWYSGTGWITGAPALSYGKFYVTSALTDSTGTPNNGVDSANYSVSGTNTIQVIGRDKRYVYPEIKLDKRDIYNSGYKIKDVKFKITFYRMVGGNLVVTKGIDGNDAVYSDLTTGNNGDLYLAYNGTTSDSGGTHYRKLPRLLLSGATTGSDTVYVKVEETSSPLDYIVDKKPQWFKVEYKYQSRSNMDKISINNYTGSDRQRFKDDYIEYSWIEPTQGGTTYTRNVLFEGDTSDRTSSNHNVGINLTKDEVPIISLDLNKLKATGKETEEALNGAKFEIKEYKTGLNLISSNIANTVASATLQNPANWNNLKIVTSASNATNTEFVTNISEFDGNTKIRFIADKGLKYNLEFTGNNGTVSSYGTNAKAKGLLLKVTEKNNASISATSAVEHYSKIYNSFYIYIENGNKVMIFKPTKEDRVRLNKQKDGNSGFENYTLQIKVGLTLWDGTNVRHQFGVDVVDLTELWIDMKKIFVDYLNANKTNITGEAAFEVTANKLEPLIAGETDKFKITQSNISEAGNSNIFKFRFLNNFSADGTLTNTFTVREIANVYNAKTGEEQYWAEIPAFTFDVKYKKHNNGYIEIDSIEPPKAVDSRYQHTIENLRAQKYKKPGKPGDGNEFIKITKKGDINASIEMGLINPLALDFKLDIMKYDGHLHFGGLHGTLDSIEGVEFKVKFDLPNGNTTDWIDLPATNSLGNTEAILRITDNDLRTGGLIPNTSETIIVHIKEELNDVSKYYYFREQYKLQVTMKVDETGHYRVEDKSRYGSSVDSTRPSIAVEINGANYNSKVNPNANVCTDFKYWTYNLTGHAYTRTGTDRPDNSVRVDVSNIRKWIVIEGTVFEDKYSEGKISELNGTKDTGENPVKGLKVILHKDKQNAGQNNVFNRYGARIDAFSGSNISTYSGKYDYSELTNKTAFPYAYSTNPGNIISRQFTRDVLKMMYIEDEILEIETKTNADGNYSFSVPMYEGTYWVEYVYNGYKYQHTKYTPWNGEGIYSNATETESDRDNFNKKFKTVTSKNATLGTDETNVSNNINSTTVNNLKYTEGSKTYDIGISAFTGGFGKDHIVRYSATVGNYTRSYGTIGERTVSNNYTPVPSEPENTVTAAIAPFTRVKDGVSICYTHKYDNVNFGITEREKVQMGLTKFLQQVELQTKRNGETVSQTYKLNDSNKFEATAPEVIAGKTGTDLDNAINGNKGKISGRVGASDQKEYADSDSFAVKSEDVHTTETSAQDHKIETVEMFVTYRIALYNYSSEIGIQFNDIVDYYDNIINDGRLKFKEASLVGGSGSITTTTSTNKNLPIYKIDNTANGSRNFKEIHLKLNNVKLNPGATQYIDVKFEMPVNTANVIKTDSEGNINENVDAELQKLAVLQKTAINVAEVYSYTTYYANKAPNEGREKTYKEHDIDDIGNIAGLVDLNSNPGNVNSLKETDAMAIKPYLPNPHESDDGIAFFRAFEVDTRKISGSVWIDNIDSNINGSPKGNGKCDDGETNYTNNVRVELRRIRLDGTNWIDETASVWKDSGTDSGYVNEGELVIQEHLVGDTYEFTGMPVGDYYVLFTYPDGQTYKSTIFDTTATSNFDVNNPDYNGNPSDTNKVVVDLNKVNSNYAHKDGSGKKDQLYSYARDIQAIPAPTPVGNNKKTREYVNNLLATSGEINGNSRTDYGNYTNTTNPEIKMDAKTGHIIVDFELTGNSERRWTITPTNNKINWILKKQFIVNGLDFGIVQRPQAQIQVQKTVENVRIELANGTILFDASERASNVIWVDGPKYNSTYDPTTRVLNEINNTQDETVTGELNMPIWRKDLTGSNYTFTMDEEVMQGATVRVKFAIKVVNIGEIDYKDNNVYYLGTEPTNAINSLVKTTPLKIVDYVGFQGDDSPNARRNNLKYVDSLNTVTWEVVNSDTLKSAGFISEDVAGSTTGPDAPTGAKAYNTIVVRTLTNEEAVANQLSPIVGSGESSLSSAYSSGTLKTEYNTNIVLSATLSSNSKTDDLTYCNLAEVLQVKNDVGRRNRYSTLGNQNPKMFAQEVDSDDIGWNSSITILPPFGEKVKSEGPEIIYNKIGTDVDYTIDICIAAAIIALTGLAIKINQKRK